MDYTFRITLGLILLSTLCWSLESRHKPDLNDSLVIQDGTNKNGNETSETVKNLDGGGASTIYKSKTDVRAENNLDKLETVKKNIASPLSVKLQKSETYPKSTEETTNHRENTGRSIDIEKYISKEFHNKNNVYKNPSTFDNEKYGTSDFHHHSTTFPEHVITKEPNFHIDTELTTPQSVLFDKKYKETVDSVDQTLEHIDTIDIPLESKEAIRNAENKSLNLENLIQKTKDNETTSDLDFVNYKNILKNDLLKKNSQQHNVIVESGTNLDFKSEFNESISYDSTIPVKQTNNSVAKDKFEPPEEQIKRNDLLKEETLNRDHTIVSTTRKSTVLLTKPPSNSNDSHIGILSNKIETENTLKAVDIKQILAANSTEKSASNEAPSSTKSSVAEPSRRGTTKFLDHTRAASTETSTSKYTRSYVREIMNNNKSNKSNEQLVQENQIIPIQVEAPINVNKTVQPIDMSEEQIIYTTAVSPTVPVTTEEVPTTVTEDFQEITSTTEESLTTVAETTAEPMTESTTEAATTEPITETVTTENPTTTVEPQTTTESFRVLSSSSTSLPVTTETTTQSLDTTTLFVTTESSTDLVRSENDTVVTTETILALETSTTPEPTTTSSTGVVQQTTLANEVTENEEITTESISRSSKGINFNAINITVKTTTETSPIESTTAQSLTTTIIPKMVSEDGTNSISKEDSTTAKSNNTPEESITEDEEDEYDDLESKKFYPVITTTENPLSNQSHSNNTKTTFETTTENNTVTDNGMGNGPDDNKGTIAAIVISSIGAICLILLAGLLFIMRKRQKRFNYGQRCTPVSLDDYSMDNVSVYNSVRRKQAVRNSKRSYGNPAFEDPVSISHPLNFAALGKFANNLDDIKSEFEEIPVITAKTNELPDGCDTKNRYANVIPLPETRVFLQSMDGYPNSDYINANFVSGPNNIKKYYIACQGPMQNTVDDFWRMCWEQQSKVILMITHLYENGVEKCFDYLPPSEVLDCHRLFGDFQVTLKKREVKDKYIISTLQLKNMVSNNWREVTHFWYLGWPDKGIPSEANSLIAFLIEARSFMKLSSIDRKEVTNGDLNNGNTKGDVNPVIVHCSPGTGRTGVVIACDIAIREFEQTRLVDVPRIVYKIRRDRASSVQTKEQYAFIYKVINLYATKLTGGALDSL